MAGAIRSLLRVVGAVSLALGVRPRGRPGSSGPRGGGGSAVMQCGGLKCRNL